MVDDRETIIDKHCIGCQYYTGITDNIYYCSYFVKEDKLRPCPPGKDCTVKKYKKGYKPKPQKPRKEKKDIIPANAVWYTYKGETKLLTEWANIVGIPKATLYCRIKVMGWSIEKALETPKILPGSNKKKEGVKDA